MQPVGELTHIPLATGVYLHLHRVPLYKTIRVDICLSERLSQQRNSRLALISRLLERGTSTHPELQSLNRFIDDLYGAHYFAAVDRLGEYQFIHLCLELIDEKYLSGAGDIFASGLDFLREVLLEPAGDGTEFKREYLAQEKHFLARQIADTYNDKLGYARQRCIEEMCRGESVVLSALGDPADFAAVHADELLALHRDLLAADRIDVFVSGDFDPDKLLLSLENFINWERRETGPTGQPDIEPITRSARVIGAAREIFEFQEIHQAQMVLGYRTPILYGTEDYPALMLLNLVFGGDGQSRLFKSLREEEGLCYYVASQTEALSGLLFVEASIEAGAYRQAKTIVEQQFDSLRQGYIDASEVEMARRLLQARLLGLPEDREAYFRFQLRDALIGGESIEDLWHRVEQVGVEDLVRVARSIAADTAYLLHGGVRTKMAI